MNPLIENLISELASVKKISCETCPGFKNKPKDCNPERQFCTLAIQRILQAIEKVG